MDRKQEKDKHRDRDRSNSSDEDAKNHERKKCKKEEVHRTRDLEQNSKSHRHRDGNEDNSLRRKGAGDVEVNTDKAIDSLDEFMELEVFPELEKLEAERLEAERLKRLDRGTRRKMTPMILGFQWGSKGCSFHGGWPTRKRFPGETYKKKHMTEKLLEELRLNWPNTHMGKTDEELWEHEWNNHGRYSQFTQVEYFEAMLHVLKKCKISTEVPSDFVVPINKHVTEEFAINTIRNQIGVDVKIDTDEYGNVHQIRVATDEYLKLIDIPRKITNPPRFVTFTHPFRCWR
ncbi:hypothetical protein OROGR_011927 [Orobanche gracilis]